MRVIRRGQRFLKGSLIRGFYWGFRPHWWYSQALRIRLLCGVFVNFLSIMYKNVLVKLFKEAPRASSSHKVTNHIFGFREFTNRRRNDGFHDFMKMVLSIHESKITNVWNSLIRKKTFQFSRIHHFLHEFTNKKCCSRLHEPHRARSSHPSNKNLKETLSAFYNISLRQSF